MSAAAYRELTFASYNGWPYAFAVNLGDPAQGNPGWDDGGAYNLGTIETWCAEQFGSPRAHMSTWSQFGLTFVFNDLAHAMAFKLRWC